MKRFKGITLIEFIVVTVVIGLVAAIAGMTLQSHYRSYLEAKDISNSNMEGQVALARMARDLHALATITAMTTTSINFTTQDGTALSYSRNAPTNALRRNTDTLASGVTALNFSYIDVNGNATAVPANVYYIVTTLTLSGANTTLSVRTTIKPWAL